MFLAGMFGAGGVIGMGRVFARMFLMGALIMRLFFVGFGARRIRCRDGGRCLDRGRNRHVRLRR